MDNDRLRMIMDKQSKRRWHSTSPFERLVPHAGPQGTQHQLLRGGYGLGGDAAGAGLAAVPAVQAGHAPTSVRQPRQPGEAVGRQTCRVPRGARPALRHGQCACAPPHPRPRLLGPQTTPIPAPPLPLALPPPTAPAPQPFPIPASDP